MIGVASLLIVVTLGLMITRVATVALRTTGLSTEVARPPPPAAPSPGGSTTASRTYRMIVALMGNWKTLAVGGAAAVLFGLLTLVWPDVTLWALVVLFGASAFVDGVFRLVPLATGVPGAREHRTALIIQGILGIGIGIVSFIWPDMTALALLFVIAAWAFVFGVVEVAAAVQLRKVIENEWLLGLMGALTIIFAIALVITPGAGALVITWLIGWFALLSGTPRLALAWKLRKLEGHGGARQRRAAGSAGGDVIAASKPWTYWISIPLFAASVLWHLTWGYLYLRKVVAAKHAASAMRSERWPGPALRRAAGRPRGSDLPVSTDLPDEVSS